VAADALGALGQHLQQGPADKRFDFRRDGFVLRFRMAAIITEWQRRGCLLASQWTEFRRANIKNLFLITPNNFS